mmetsp:Transcript_52763/g.87404  ORF Transcript_52763/g.87404 Transcript_52763/m.87404 type:complete len:319 (+) Transcript_52763:958-1914(+)
MRAIRTCATDTLQVQFKLLVLIGRFTRNRQIQHINHHKTEIFRLDQFTIIRIQQLTNDAHFEIGIFRLQSIQQRLKFLIADKTGLASVETNPGHFKRLGLALFVHHIQSINDILVRVIDDGRKQVEQEKHRNQDIDEEEPEKCAAIITQPGRPPNIGEVFSGQQHKQRNQRLEEGTKTVPNIIGQHLIARQQRTSVVRLGQLTILAHLLIVRIQALRKRILIIQRMASIIHQIALGVVKNMIRDACKNRRNNEPQKHQLNDMWHTRHHNIILPTQITHKQERENRTQNTRESKRVAVVGAGNREIQKQHRQQKDTHDV